MRPPPSAASSGITGSRAISPPRRRTVRSRRRSGLLLRAARGACARVRRHRSMTGRLMVMIAVPHAHHAPAALSWVCLLSSLEACPRHILSQLLAHAQPSLCMERARRAAAGRGPAARAETTNHRLRSRLGLAAPGPGSADWSVGAGAWADAFGWGNAPARVALPHSQPALRGRPWACPRRRIAPAVRVCPHDRGSPQSKARARPGPGRCAAHGWSFKRASPAPASSLPSQGPSLPKPLPAPRPRQRSQTAAAGPVTAAGRLILCRPCPMGPTPSPEAGPQARART